MIAQTVGVLAASRVPTREVVLPALKGLIPSWVILTTVVVATTAICATAIMRSRAELRASAGQFESLQAQIQNLRDTNDVLQRDISRLTKDPAAIELAARERLGMVRANDVVVTMDSISRSARTSNVSFVR